MKIIIVLTCMLSVIKANPSPIVLWHGMGDTCCFAVSLGYFKQFLEKEIPGVYVLSIRIGDSVIDDFENGYFMHPNKQVDLVCKMLAEENKLKDGFNAIGFSQGSQFLRAVVQRCGHTLPPVKNLISIGGQHQGVYGLPHCGALEYKACEYVREALNYAAYTKFVQQTLVQATYWHDPVAEDTYRHKSEFLADINNELSINQTYVDNLKKLNKFVLVLFGNDTIVQPKETEWFGFYKPGQSKELYKMQDSELYLQERLGLKWMDSVGKLVFLSSEGDHLRFDMDWFREKIIAPYLRN